MTLTVQGVAERYSVSEHAVLSWIRTGELRAINCGRQTHLRRGRDGGGSQPK